MSQQKTYKFTAFTAQKDGETFDHPGPLGDAIVDARNYAVEAFPAWEYKGYGPRIRVMDADTGETVHVERL